MARRASRWRRLRCIVSAVMAALTLSACALPTNGVSVLGVHLVGPRGFATVKNRIIGPDGQPFIVLGVDRPSLEWSSTGDHISAQDFQHMAA